MCSTSRLLTPMSNRSFTGNLSAVLVAKGVSFLAGLVTLGYAARTLGPEHYGMWSFATALTAYATLLLAPGLMTWGTRKVAQQREHAGRILVAVNLTQLILAT